MHPRTKLRLKQLGLSTDNPKIHFLAPFGFFDYIKLQMNAYCILSDSGTITEEASILNLPAVTIRNAHERPDGMDEGTLVMSGLKPDSILSAIDLVLAHSDRDKRVQKIVPDYDTDTVSKKILSIVLSYTDYINRVVWFKNGN